MNTGDVFLFVMLGFIYLAVVLTIGLATYRKGRMVLFIVGFLMPLLWLIGAILPAKKGSKFEHQQDDYWRDQSKSSQSSHHHSG
ncbi:MAG: hypothetical protein ACJ789_07890 [Thermomicrobiales bacterium]